VAQGANFVLRIGSVMVLARLLEPADFGLVGMVTAVTGAFGLFKDAGLSVASVQRAEITDQQLSGLFWVNVLVGAVLAAIAAGLAPAMVAFYDEPRLFWIAIVLGMAFLVNAAGVQHSAILQRQMRFATLAAIDMLSWIVSIVVGIGLALLGAGYWALVWMSVALPAVGTAGVWLTAAWLPEWPRRGAGIRSMLRFGGTVTLNTVVVYVAYNTDKLLIGKLWGAEALGIYGRAYQLINIPTENLNGAVGGVAISALSRLQDDVERFRSYFLKSYSLVLAFTLPVTIAFAVFPHDIIHVLLGPKWDAVAPIFRLMAPTIVAFALLNPLGWMLFSNGNVGRSLKMAFVIAPVVILGYVTGLPFGATGVAAGYSIAMVVLVVPMIVWATHRSSISARDVTNAIISPLLSAAIATAVTYPVVLAAYSLQPIPRLLIGTTVLVSIYLLMLLFVMGQKRFYLGLLRDSTNAVLGRPGGVPVQ
jgi:PST family polysaccharide transporter